MKRACSKMLSVLSAGVFCLGACGGKSQQLPSPSGPGPSSPPFADNTVLTDPLSALLLSYSKPIDPASLSTATISLTVKSVRGPASRVVARMELSPNGQALFIQPQRPFARYPHRLTLSGLKYKDGTGVDPLNVGFTLQPIKKTVFQTYSNGSVVRANTTTESETESRTVASTGPGANGVWGDADDTVGSWRKIASTSPNVYVTTRYTAPGTDGVWFTNDDSISLVTTDTYSDDGKLITSATRYAGNDSTFGDADDSVLLTTYIQEASRIRSTIKDIGPDFAANTNDDVASTSESSCYEQQINGLGDITSTREFLAGTDTQCFTSDDVLISLQEETFDDNRNSLSYRYIIDGTVPGYDELRTQSLFSYFNNGYRQTTRESEAGTDDIFGTNDDIPTAISKHSEDGLSYRRYSPGPDSLLDTADDVLESESISTL